MNTIPTQSRTLFDQFPTEILYLIFEYLSNNDIIYTFFFFNQRLNSLLLENPRYLNHLELPIKNVNFWKDILLQIGSQVKSVNITTVDTSFPLTYFSNLRTLIISSPFGIPNEEFRAIVDSNLFSNLHSFELYETNRYICEYEFYQDIITTTFPLEKVFQNENSLTKFAYLSSTYPLKIREFTRLQINSHLQSLTIELLDFKDIYVLLSYTPNLQNLYLRSEFPYDRRTFPQRIDVHLKKLSIEFSAIYRYEPPNNYWYEKFDANQFKNFLHQFSSSLIYLSVDLIECSLQDENDFPFNESRFQQCLEPMTQLKTFHFVAHLHKPFRPEGFTLPTFSSQFWSDHNWSFKIYNDYLFTLPYHFDHFYPLVTAMRDVTTNNPRVWKSIKNINLYLNTEFSWDLIKQLRIELPKLTNIGIHSNLLTRYSDLPTQLNRNQTSLPTVTTIHFEGASTWDHMPAWFIDLLPNLKHLTIENGDLPTIDDELIPILNTKIQQLHLIFDFSPSGYQEVLNQCYTYFSNIEYMHICSIQNHLIYEAYANVCVQILKNLQNLKLLTVNCVRDLCHGGAQLDRKFKQDHFNEITIMFDVKIFSEYIVISKRGIEISN